LRDAVHNFVVDSRSGVKFRISKKWHWQSLCYWDKIAVNFIH